MRIFQKRVRTLQNNSDRFFKHVKQNFYSLFFEAFESFCQSLEEKNK